MSQDESGFLTPDGHLEGFISMLTIRLPSPGGRVSRVDANRHLWLCSACPCATTSRVRP